SSTSSFLRKRADPFGGRPERLYARGVDAPQPPLDETRVDRDPFRQFLRWFEHATVVTRTPEAAALATASADGAPSVRMVLLKRWEPDGFVFHTNLRSRKGRELGENPRAAL